MSEPTPTRRGVLRAAGIAVAATAATQVLGTGAADAAAVRPRPRRTFGPRRPRRFPSAPVTTAPVTTAPVTTAPVTTAPTPVAPAPSAPVPAPSATLPALPTDEAFVLHLLRRTTYGLTPTLLAEVRATGPQAWLDQQMGPEGIDDTVCEAVLPRFPHYRSDPPKVHADLPFGAWDAMLDARRVALTRAIWSRRQLLEVMVEFWSNVLHTQAPSGDVWSAKCWDDRNVIRPHALGRFSDMLVASGRSPAMLRYLDGAESRASAPNENYGRELLELHTVGRSAGYTQADVVAVARALTGRTTWTPWEGGTAANLGEFRYRPEWHHVGPLQVLGWSHANASTADGLAVGDSLLRHLARHPATAARLAHRLCVRFVQDDPPAGLVDRLAQVYLASDTAILPVLRALLASPEFAASAHRKHRRPYEDVVAGARALGVEPAATGTKAFDELLWNLGQTGHEPFNWHAPDGFPDVVTAWTGTGSLLARWNVHVGLAQGWWKDGLRYPASLYAHVLPGPRPATRAELVTRTAAALMPGTPFPPAHRDALVTFLGGPGPLGGGDTEWLFPILVALLLDSPSWSLR